MFFNGVLFSNSGQNGPLFVLFSKGPDHSKTELLASLGHFIYSIVPLNINQLRTQSRRDHRASPLYL